MSLAIGVEEGSGDVGIGLLVGPPYNYEFSAYILQQKFVGRATSFYVSRHSAR
jgi:hypothetical protein